MSRTMEYKDYTGSMELSEADGAFYGKVIGICALASYEGESARALVKDFHDAVDDYLASCVAEEIEPERAYKGSFNGRISPNLHKEAARIAAERGISLNKFIEKAVKNEILIETEPKYHT